MISASVSRELTRNGIVLATLGGHLTGIGEILVEVQLLTATELANLREQPVTLFLKVIAHHRERGVSHGVSVVPCPRPARGPLPSRAGPIVARTGVRGVVDGPQPFRRHLRVHLRGREARVPEELLHHADVGPVIEHVRCARVAERVRVELVGEAGPVTRGPHDEPGALAREPSTACVEEHRRLRPRAAVA